MKVLLRAELYKLLHSKWMWAFAIFTSIFAMFLMAKSKSSENVVQFWAESDFYQMVSVLVVLYGIVIVHEYASGYFKEAVCAGHLKWEVYLVRYFAFFIGALVILVSPCLSALLFSSCIKGNILTVSQLRAFFIGIAFLVLYCVCISAFFMMLAVVVKTYSMIVFSSIFFNMLVVVIYEIIPAESFAGWMKYSFAGIQHTMFFQPMEIEKALLLLFSFLGQSILYTGIGVFYFTKKELR